MKENVKSSTYKDEWTERDALPENDVYGDENPTKNDNTSSCQPENRE